MSKKNKYLPVDKIPDIKSYNPSNEKFVCPLCNGTGIITRGLISIGCSCQANTIINNIRNDSPTDWKNE